MLAIYDWLVLGFSNRFIWKCPTRGLLQLYDANVTDNHLEVGVGTGFFLDRARFPSSTPRLVLLDLNPNCLDATMCRVNRYRPQALRANVLEPIAFTGEPFDSVGMNYVLHCLPGTLKGKACVFNHLAALLKPGGVIFGSTLLSHGVPIGRPARRLMRYYNRRGIFSNEEDGLDDLKAELDARFAEVSVTVVGCAGVFVARKSAVSLPSAGG